MITHLASSSGTVEAKASRIGWSSAPLRSGLEIVRRATPGAGSSTRRRPVGLGEDNEWVALRDRLPLLHQDLLDLAWILGLDRHLHLHRLQDHHSVALVDLVANRDLDLPHGAGDVGLDLRQNVLLAGLEGALRSGALGLKVRCGREDKLCAAWEVRPRPRGRRPEFDQFPGFPLGTALTGLGPAVSIPGGERWRTRACSSARCPDASSPVAGPSDRCPRYRSPSSRSRSRWRRSGSSSLSADRSRPPRTLRGPARCARPCRARRSP